MAVRKRISDLPEHTVITNDDLFVVVDAPGGVERETRKATAATVAGYLVDYVGIAAYVHTQGVASSLWTINHNLGSRCNVTVVDSTGRQVEGDVVFQDDNTVVIEFSGAFSGSAYLS